MQKTSKVAALLWYVGNSLGKRPN